MEVLTTRDLAVGYGRKTIVDNLQLEGEKGVLLCILGPNGAGKTTILRTLAGLLEPVRGAVYIRGEEISQVDNKTLAKKLSVVLTNKFSGGLMTVFEVVSMGRYPHTGFFGKLSREDMDKIVQALETVNGTYLINRYFDELSDGEKQKVLIARALVQEPDIIILDEPTSHLDIRHRLELIEILKILSRERGISVILSLHEIDLALKSCDKVVLVNENTIKAYGRVEDVTNEDIIKDLYSIKDASFNNLLGSIELNNASKPETFVVAGGGKGTNIYRLLTKYGIGFSTGIVHRNDIDYEIARTMGVDIESVEAFENINGKNMAKAGEMVDRSKIIIDSGFPLGHINKGNLDLIRGAIDRGKKVLSLRKEEEGQELYGDRSNGIAYLESLSSMLEILQKEL